MAQSSVSCSDFSTRVEEPKATCAGKSLRQLSIEAARVCNSAISWRDGARLLSCGIPRPLNALANSSSAAATASVVMRRRWEQASTARWPRRAICLGSSNSGEGRPDASPSICVIIRNKKPKLMRLARSSRDWRASFTARIAVRPACPSIETVSAASRTMPGLRMSSSRSRPQRRRSCSVGAQISGMDAHGSI